MSAPIQQLMHLWAGLQYQILATPAPGVHTRYFRMRDFCKICFVVIVDTLAAAATVVATIMQATDGAGTGAAAIAAATATLTANTECSVVTVTLATVLVADTVTINGVVFTAAAAPDFPNLVFDQSGADAADAASLAACINAAAGQAALLAAGGHITAAVLAGAVVTLTVSNPGEEALTVTSVGGTMTLATVQGIMVLEVDDSRMTGANDFIGLQLVGPATAHATVAVIRGNQSRYDPPALNVGAADYEV